MLMKIPKLQSGEDPAAIVSFEMELMILPRLQGRYVPRFIASRGFEAQPYIVMERIEGSSLLPLLENLPLPIKEVVAIALRSAIALDDLHQQDVVHLDIKPSNILRRPNGDVVLADFGPVKALKVAFSSVLRNPVPIVVSRLVFSGAVGLVAVLVFGLAFMASSVFLMLLTFPVVFLSGVMVWLLGSGSRLMPISPFTGRRLGCKGSGRRACRDARVVDDHLPR